MVLLECAMFVSKLRTQDLPSVWVIHNKESNTHLMRSVSHNLSKWGEAIGEKLRLIELKEREALNRLRFSTDGDKSATSFMLSEEPVFPVDLEQTNDSEEHMKNEMCQAVSYAVKMSACMLLLEITRFLRDPPSHFFALSVSQVSTPRVSTTFIDSDRKPSVSSVNSTDTESVKGGGYSSLPNREFFSSQSPNIGRFGSNLSVEDAEPPTFKQSVSIEESGSLSPQKKRTSVYLRVNSTGGTISRTNSLKRPAKLVRVTDSPGPIRSNIQASPVVRSRRKTIVTSPATALHQSLYTGHRGARRPSVVGLASSISVSTYHPLPIKYRRKSVGAPLFKQASLSEADRHITPSDPAAGGSSKATGAGTTLGTSLNLGLTKLKRAFTKRRVTKSRPPTEPGLSPGSSPGYRKKYVTGHRLSPTSSFHLPHCEDKGYHCSWLNIVEHLIVVECSLPPNVRHRHSLSCRGLIVALKKVYSATFKEEEDEEPSRDYSIFTPSRSISMMFTPRLSLKRKSKGDSGSGAATYRRGLSLPDSVSRRRSRKSNVIDNSKRSTSLPFSSVNSVAGSSQGSSSPFASLNFSRMSYDKFPTTFLGAVDHRNEENIELFLENESAYPHSYLNAELDNQRREYVMSELLGLVHVPFSILLHAAPALHPSTLSNLKVLAWDSLLDRDPELSQTAGECSLLVL